jgi:hypothetical protein
MMFSKEQQQLARGLFIKECPRKPAEPACGADFLSKQHNKQMVDYEKLKTEDASRERPSSPGTACGAPVRESASLSVCG